MLQWLMRYISGCDTSADAIAMLMRRSMHQWMRCVGGCDCDVDAVSHASVDVIATFMRRSMGRWMRCIGGSDVDAVIDASLDAMRRWMRL